VVDGFRRDHAVAMERLRREVVAALPEPVLLGV
jgi:hypothetical protein